MNTIIPLAGPDFFHESYGIKPLIPYEGLALYESLLKGRAWFHQLKQVIFVLQESVQGRDEFLAHARKSFPTAQFVFLSAFTRGALMSSLAAAALIQDFRAPLVVDLLDIDYSWKGSPPEEILGQNDVYGLVPFFHAQDSQFSYLQVDSDMRIVQTVEKKVISSLASAGTYFFKDLATFLAVLPGNLKHFETYAYQGNLFLCPAYNELIKSRHEILAQEVTLKRSISLEVKKMSLK